jgi:hypothetical protein
MAMDAGLWLPRRPHADSRLRADARDRTPCSPLPATTSALGYNEDRRQLQLMDGWQASKAWRANLRAEYKRGWGPWQEALRRGSRGR